MNKERLEEIRMRVEKAQVATWRELGGSATFRAFVSDNPRFSLKVQTVLCPDDTAPEIDFISHLAEDVLDLLAALEETCQK